MFWPHKFNKNIIFNNLLHLDVHNNTKVKIFRYITRFVFYCLSELRGFTRQKYFLQAMKLYFAFSTFIFNPLTMRDCFQITFFETQTDDRLCYCSSIINNDQQLCNTGCFVHSSKGSAVRSNEGTSRQLHKCLQPSWGSINALSLHFWRPERSARPSSLEVQTPEELQRRRFTAGDQRVIIYSRNSPSIRNQEERSRSWAAGWKPALEKLLIVLPYWKLWWKYLLMTFCFMTKIWWRWYH